MEEKDQKKKKKLTLSISSKKSFSAPHYTRDKQKKSVLIEKKTTRRWGEKKFQPKGSNFSKTHSSTSFPAKKPQPNRSFDIRKIAEERATKRFKTLKEDNFEVKKSNLGKSKSPISKREYKLTLSKALDEEAMDGKERSLASVRRARLKEKNQVTKDKKIETKKIVHEVDIPDKITIQELSNRMAM